MFFRHVSSANQSASSVQASADGSAAPPIPRKLLLWLTYGTAGTVLFPIIYLIEGVTRPGYVAWGQTISALSLGPGGWIQQLNFAFCGVSVLWSAYVWRKILAGGVCAIWYPILRAVEGAGLLTIAIITHDPFHTVVLIVIVNAMCFGLLVISRRFWGNPNWRGWATFSAIMAAWLLVFMSFFGIALNPHGALASYVGLFERLATNADTIWTLALLACLWIRRPTGI